MLKRILYFGYGLTSYVIFLGVLVYAIGFIGGFATPTMLDGPREGSFWAALAINLGLLALFAVQHSVMARRGFKEWWTKFVPKPIERSTYVLATNLALIAMFAFWQPMGGEIWHVDHPVGRALLYAGYGLGLTIVLIATFLINHFDLFGMRQVTLYLMGREYTPLPFKTPMFYNHVRHPLYVGWFLTFWMTPTMTIAHLVFAIMTTAYILIAIRFEERDLIREHGMKYIDYRKRVPMLIPRFARRRAETKVTA